MGSALGVVSGIATGGAVSTAFVTCGVHNGADISQAILTSTVYGSVAGIGVDIVVDEAICGDEWWGGEPTLRTADETEL